MPHSLGRMLCRWCGLAAWEHTDDVTEHKLTFDVDYNGWRNVLQMGVTCELRHRHDPRVADNT